jgi:hypothetical protein
MFTTSVGIIGPVRLSPSDSILPNEFGWQAMSVVRIDVIRKIFPAIDILVIQVFS